MAGIDKIYMTKYHYTIFNKWVMKNTYLPYWQKLAIKSFMNVCRGKLNKGFENYYCVCNFPEWINYLLIHECPFAFIQNRLEQQYGETIESLREKSCLTITLI